LHEYLAYEILTRKRRCMHQEWCL